LADGERAGLVVQGAKHFYIAIDKTNKGKTLSVYEGRKENCGFPPNSLTTTEISSDVVWLKVQVFPEQKYKFAYSFDGVRFIEIEQLFEATKGVWIGAKVGLFCISPGVKKGKGFIDADYFRVQGGVLASPQAQAVQTSGNPVFEGWYADPEAIVYGDTYWIYPTWSVAFDKQTFFDCFSSKDLITWTKHASIIDTTEVKWAKKALWAPSVIQKGDKYYFFFGANCLLKDSETGGIGVAVSDRPEGPYKDLLGKPLIGKIVNGAQPIDQFVFRDGDAYYMYYGGWGHCNLVKLSDDFTSLVPFEDGTTFKEITPKSYVEGPFMFKRNGKYYFMWSEGGWTGPDYSVAYSISDSPFGPFERIGKILQQDVTVATGAGHHSVIHIPDSDDYYIVYHRHPLGDNDGNHRVTCIDKMTFDEKGFINPVKMTSEGVEAKIISTNNK
jgi:beta-xylosidase